MASFGGNYGGAQGGSGPGGKGPTGKGSGGGEKASGMSSAAADHLVATGKIRTPSIPSTGVAQGKFNTQDDAHLAYSKAVGDYATRGTFGRIADFLAGPWYDQNEPMAGNPRSFSKGTWHSSTNPAGALVGLASPFGTGTITGPVAGMAYNKSGLPDVWHGGYDQPDMRSGPLGNTPAGYDQGKSFADLGGTHASMFNGNGADQQAGGFTNTGGGSPMAAFPQAPGGAPFGAQPAPQVPGAPATPTGFFSPKIPNHTLPQSYQSLFPTSLSEEDKALLYGKALMA